VSAHSVAWLSPSGFPPRETLQRAVCAFSAAAKGRAKQAVENSLEGAAEREQQKSGDGKPELVLRQNRHGQKEADEG
jgi:hypothetical protein